MDEFERLQATNLNSHAVTDIPPLSVHGYEETIHASCTESVCVCCTVVDLRFSKTHIYYCTLHVRSTAMRTILPFLIRSMVL